MDISVTIQGDQDFRLKLLGFIGTALNLTKSMEETGSYLTKFYGGKVFVSRGQAIGEPWPALNPSYAALKARQWPGRPPLVQTGLMQRGFKHKSTKLTTELWNEAEYFEYHQEGRGVPQRMMMKIDEQRAKKIAGFVMEDIIGQMKARGLI